MVNAMNRLCLLSIAFSLLAIMISAANIVHLVAWRPAPASTSGACGWATEGGKVTVWFDARDDGSCHRADAPR